MVQPIPEINIFMEHLGSLQGLSRCLEHWFLQQRRVICRHFNFILFTATPLKSVNIDFSRVLNWLLRCFSYCLQSWCDTTLEKKKIQWTDQRHHFSDYTQVCGSDHTPHLLQVGFRVDTSNFTLSLLFCKLSHSTIVLGCSTGKEGFHELAACSACIPRQCSWILHPGYCGSSLVSPPAPAAPWVQPAAETAHGTPHWGHPGFPPQQGLMNIIRKKRKKKNQKKPFYFITQKQKYLLKVTLLFTRI